MSAGGGPRKTPPATLGLDLDSRHRRGSASDHRRGRRRTPSMLGGFRHRVRDGHGEFVVGRGIGGSTSRLFQTRAVARPAGARSPVLIVAWGSAPGVPNWGGLSRNSATTFELADATTRAAPVARPRRRWRRRRRGSTSSTSPTSRGPGTTAARTPRAATSPSPGWRAAVSEIATPYARVLNLGDSMGASAALLSRTSRTRPSRFVRRWTSSPRPFDRGEARGGCVGSNGRCTPPRTGRRASAGPRWRFTAERGSTISRRRSWCPRRWGRGPGRHRAGRRVVEHPVDNHRLALALEEGGELLPLVRGALMEQMAAAGVGPREDGVESRGGGEGGAVDDLTRRRSIRGCGSDSDRTMTRETDRRTFARRLGSSRRDSPRAGDARD